MDRERGKAERQGVAAQRAHGSHRRRAPHAQHAQHAQHARGNEAGDMNNDALRRAMDLLTAEARYAVKAAERSAKTPVSS